MSDRATGAPRIAVFAGTTEGRELCERLSAAGIAADAFAATDYGADLVSDLPDIAARAGRLDEADMERALSAFDVVVDATHPYAAAASDNIERACTAVGARYLRLLRPSTLSAEEDGEAPVIVSSPADAAAFLGTVDGNVLLTTGSKELAAYTAVPDFESRVFPRVLPETSVVAHCHDLGFPTSQLICMQGPFSRDLNVAMLQAVRASWMVTKDTGRAGGFDEKMAAAREAGARVVVIARPRVEEGLSVDEVISEIETAALTKKGRR